MQSFFETQILSHRPRVLVFALRGGFNNPSHGHCPPGPSRTTFSQKVNGKGGTPPLLHGRSVAKKLTEKGGTPPPLHGQSDAKNRIFRPKNTVFGPIFNGFFLNGKGGYSPPPSRTVGSKKPNGKKLTERGGTPPPFTDNFRDWGF